MTAFRRGNERHATKVFLQQFNDLCAAKVVCSNLHTSEVRSPAYVRQPPDYGVAGRGQPPARRGLRPGEKSAVSGQRSEVRAERSPDHQIRYLGGSPRLARESRALPIQISV